MVSYYPMNLDYTVRAPSSVGTDWAALIAAYPGRTFMFPQVGYPTDALCKSSQTKQRNFVGEVFKAWDTHASQISMVMFLWLHDLAPETASGFGSYYGINDPKFLAYLRTLGLRTYEGFDKSAFPYLKRLARARGW